ncbi:MAG: hypothetical protein QNJ47_03045 [Nostocaceae cyanobacterium]|nr:hypothetical protein [Nostocaceae cyanobacterium]
MSIVKRGNNNNQKSKKSKKKLSLFVCFYLMNALVKLMGSIIQGVEVLNKKQLEALKRAI